LAYGSALLAEIAWIRADAERLQIESERRRDVRSALRAIPERLAVVELEAKLSGQIDTAPKNVTINVQAISPEEAVEYARDILVFGVGASMPLNHSTDSHNRNGRAVGKPEHSKMAGADSVVIYSWHHGQCRSWQKQSPYPLLPSTTSAYRFASHLEV